MPTAGLRPLIGLTSYRQTTAWWSWERDAALVPGTYLDVVVAAGGQPLIVPPDLAGEGPQRGDRSDRAVRPAARRTRGADPHRGRRPRCRPVRPAPGSPQRRDQPKPGRSRDRFGERGPAPRPAHPGHLSRPAGAQRGARWRPRAAPAGSGRADPSAAAGRVRSGAGDDRAVEHGCSACSASAPRSSCSHHQAIDTVAPGLVVTARSADGVVEAVELPGRRFVVGVQWHPEEDGDLRLFEALVAAARSDTDPPVGTGARS